jgi:hypothetical protein
LVVLFQRYSLLTASEAETTPRVALSMTNWETKAPMAPWSRTMPTVLVISWFIRTVTVPLPLSKAPNPSGTPTMRQGVPSALVPAMSPAEMMARNWTLDWLALS